MSGKRRQEEPGNEGAGDVPDSLPANRVHMPEPVLKRLKSRGLLSDGFGYDTCKLIGKPVEILLKDARSRDSALAGMHVLAEELSQPGAQRTKLLDVGRLPQNSPSTSLPHVASTSQFLVGSSPGDGKFTLRWLLTEETLAAFGWADQSTKFNNISTSFLTEKTRGMLLVPAPT